MTIDPRAKSPDTAGINRRNDDDSAKILAAYASGKISKDQATSLASKPSKEPIDRFPVRQGPMDTTPTAKKAPHREPHPSMPVKRGPDFNNLPGTILTSYARKAMNGKKSKMK